MAVISMKALLETGVHFGHRTRKWNPRMKPYIFTERNGIHIIDLQQTLNALETAYALIRETVAAGGTLLFVGTKRQAQETIQTEAERCGMPYVNARWLGGTLTNWRTIRSRIDELTELERRRDTGELERLTKKEAMMIGREIERLQDRLGGIREMRALPKLLFVVDVRREEAVGSRGQRPAPSGHRAGRHQLRSRWDRLRDPIERRRHPRHQAPGGKDRRCRPGGQGAAQG